MHVPVISAADKAKKSGAVTSIRYWSGGSIRVLSSTRLSRQVSGPELKHPDRLVFNLFNTKLDPAVDKDPLPVNDGILRQVRVSQYAPDIVRIVLDLASIKSYAAFARDPERLVIDVTGEDDRGGARRRGR
jgi:N-acetylmuramoyl-L-alanine amidase